MISNDDSPNITRPFNYAEWFLSRRKEVTMQTLLTTTDKSELSFEQLLAFKVAEGEDFEEEPFRTFLESLSELTLFKMFVSVKGDPSQARLPDIWAEIDQFIEQHKFVFEAELSNTHL